MRKYTVTVNYDCKRYVENIYANNLREANNYAISVGCKITNGGSTGWLQSVSAKQGWVGSKVGVVHSPKTDNDKCLDLE